MSTTVVNKRFQDYDVYIGRGSKWGNPFSHMEGTLALHKVETREEAIYLYSQWIQTQPHLLAALHELKGKRLGCYCKNPRSKKPIACHGDVLAELADREGNDDEETEYEAHSTGRQQTHPS